MTRRFKDFQEKYSGEAADTSVDVHLQQPAEKKTQEPEFTDTVYGVDEILVMKLQLQGQTLDDKQVCYICMPF